MLNESHILRSTSTHTVKHEEMMGIFGYYGTMMNYLWCTRPRMLRAHEQQHVACFNRNTLSSIIEMIMLHSVLTGKSFARNSGSSWTPNPGFPSMYLYYCTMLISVVIQLCYARYFGLPLRHNLYSYGEGDVWRFIREVVDRSGDCLSSRSPL